MVDTFQLVSEVIDIDAMRERNFGRCFVEKTFPGKVRCAVKISCAVVEDHLRRQNWHADNLNLWHKESAPTTNGATIEATWGPTIKATTAGTCWRETASARIDRREVATVRCSTTKALELSRNMWCCVGKRDAASGEAAAVEGVGVDRLDWHFRLFWHGRSWRAECRKRGAVMAIHSARRSRRRSSGGSATSYSTAPGFEDQDFLLAVFFVFLIVLITEERLWLHFRICYHSRRRRSVFLLILRMVFRLLLL
jgi:hypothetical protein